ncbi:site-specific DNA-methyltransferase [Desulfolucanica intricata]|uniref:site-specific DNA-methyltransferase n=1 Tax=Desulfolucanica intricata TaxID=1285191 RepID=UPI00082EE138|nr:site-specific DNA-methyltransferase [Desulfolucanica intricata]
MSEIKKIDLRSKDIVVERINKLRDLLPEAFREGKIDFKALKQVLGEEVDTGRERYGLTWAGKSEAIKNIQTPSVGTLVPVPGESVNFDTSENLIIEGDNLEVLKLLQKSYHGKVKLIYIDPPYNTGNEFIYPDNFREGLEDYLRYSGQKNGDGIKLTTNTETDGRFHSKWLNMMYPRLFLARNLLRKDGVIFVSIDDHEVHNLRLLMNEIFGEENFVATVIWQKVFSPKNTARLFSVDHDFIIIYARNAQIWSPNLLPRTAEMEARYNNPDNDPRGPWTSSDLCARNYYSEGTYSVTCPSGRIIAGPPKGTYWRVSKDKFKQLDADGRIFWGPEGNNMPRLKRYLSEVKEGLVPQTLWKYKDVGHTQEAKKELLSMVEFAGSDSVFNTPKPTRLVDRILRIATTSDSNDVILDFFAGTGTTGEAVLKINEQDDGNRKFILVQLPEPTKKTDYPTIVNITKERLRQAIARLKGANGKKDVTDKDTKQDRGFKVFKLTSSNFKIWDAAEASRDADELAKQLTLFADNLKTDRSQLDILYEILIKAGLPLTTKVERITAGGQHVFSVADGQLLVCLEQVIYRETLRGMLKLQPRQVICLDTAFHGQDKLKTNTVLEMKSHDIQFRTV